MTTTTAKPQMTAEQAQVKIMDALQDWFANHWDLVEESIQDEELGSEVLEAYNLVGMDFNWSVKVTPML